MTAGVSGLEIAIVGMAGRFPQADDTARFWRNLVEGRECITFFEREELEQAGIDKASLDQASYVRARGVVTGIDRFDAGFFGYSPREAAILDPQIRLFHECCWHALEDAGCDPMAYPGKIGLYVGAATSLAWLRESPLLTAEDGPAKYEAATLSFKDAISTLTSYRLGLTGPSVTLYTACSTSLLGIHLACRSLLMGESGIALAGGVSIVVPEKSGYHYFEGLTASPDGHTRPFDEGANGTVFSSGVGVVVLRPLQDALDAGDRVYAVIRASASNNDGDRKVGYPAPSVKGQSDVVADALALAEVSCEDVSYIETHGTATAIGDPIELEALTRAFATRRRGFCALGALKANIGHLDAAAGVAGLIKTALCLHHRIIPPTINFHRPSSRLNLVESPFYVNTEVRAWDSEPGVPRRAGVSAFGLGGTNVHVILEEARPAPRSGRMSGPFLLPVSARTPDELAAATANLGAFLDDRSDVELGDVARTLQLGRRAFQYRRAFVCDDLDDARRRVNEPGAPVAANLGRIGLQAVFEGPASVARAVRGLLTAPDIRAAVHELLPALGPIRCSADDDLIAVLGERRAYVACGLAVTRALAARGVRPGSFAGTGLGELVALACAGTISPAEAMRRADAQSGPAAQPPTADRWFQIRIGSSRSGTDSAADSIVLDVRAEHDGEGAGAWLRLLAALWEHGVAVSWPDPGPGIARITSLPLYPFTRERHWPQARTAARAGGDIAKRPAIEDWFYTPTWIARAAPARRERPGTCLVLTGSHGLGEAYATLLGGRGVRVIRAAIGATFVARTEADYTISPAAEDLARLIRELAAQGAPPATIVNFWSIEDAGSPSADIHRAFHVPVLIGKAIGAANLAVPIAYFHITAELSAHDPGERVRPEQHLAIAPALVLPQEYPNILCKVIDLGAADLSTAVTITAAAVAAEVAAPISEPVVAVRGSRRFVRAFDPLRDEIAGMGSTASIRGDGTYLITGGLGNVGFALAEHIARQTAANLVLVGRTSLPGPADWDAYLARGDREPQVVERIERIRRLQALGSRVRYVASDLADAASIGRWLDDCERELGPLRGVVHAAGVLRVHSGQVTIDRVTPADVAEQFQAKVGGLLALDTALAGRALDVRILVSSLSPILGGLGFVAYAGANAFLDGFAAATAARPEGGWLSVNWGDWQLHRRKTGNSLLGKSIEALEMTPEEGGRTFEIVLGLRARHGSSLVISSGDLHARLHQWVRTEAPGDGPAASPAPPAAAEQLGSQRAIERAIAEVWREFYGVDQVDRDANFFDLGAKSLEIVQILSLLVRKLGRALKLDEIFEYPSISQLAAHLARGAAPPEVTPAAGARAAAGRDIAIIGMAGRFPGAPTIHELWANVRRGVDSISRFTVEELLAAGLPEAEVRSPSYVRAKGYLAGTDEFDAAFFGYVPRDAAELDPQIRLFHECVWEGFEHAGYDIKAYDGRVGVYCGASPNLHWQFSSLLSGLAEPSGLFQTTLLNDKDSLSTQISYKLDLKGPSVNVFTGCSTSLVAVDAACRALEGDQCDMAVAGGVTVSLPAKAGYLYEEGMLFSPTGRVRAFDDGADGMLFGDGLGVVIVKRLADAVRDGDTVYAIIKASDVANDGSRKIGYTAPGVDGQARVIRSALHKAGLRGEDISYIETHGTGTKLGDTVEISALRKAYETERRGFCYVGSVKTNIGHLNAASGIAGLIKTVMSLRHRELAPTLNFETPNRDIPFEDSPFRVNVQLRAWDAPFPRRAGVSSFGIGGTNAHVILEEAPPDEPRPARRWQILPLSARTDAALGRASERLRNHLGQQPEPALADVAFTLQVGRRPFPIRAAIVCDSIESAHAKLEASAAPAPARALQDPQLVFLFPGQGAQYVNMGRGLLEQEEVFRAALTTCLDTVRSLTGEDLMARLYPAGDAAATGAIELTQLVQPLLFSFEYSLAKLLMHYGLSPSAMLGYSFGEYVAACLSGVFSVTDALRLVVRRGELMVSLPTGAMLGVPAGEAEVRAMLAELAAERGGEPLALAIDNGDSCVVSGAPEAIAGFKGLLQRRRLIAFPVAVGHAAHSPKLSPLVPELEAAARGIVFHAPRLPYVSNVTGDWITAAEATDPGYWARHMCETVRFARGVETVRARGEAVFVEVGPGMDLSMVVRRLAGAPKRQVLNVVRPAESPHDDGYYFRHALARLWTLGLPIDWRQLHAGEQRRRVELPTYPFERVTFQAARPVTNLEALLAARDERLEKKPAVEDWFYAATWMSRAAAGEAAVPRGARWLVFADDQIGPRLAASLGAGTIVVRPGPELRCTGPGHYTVPPGSAEDVIALWQQLAADGCRPDAIAYAWSLEVPAGDPLDPTAARAAQRLGYHAFASVAAALTRLRDGAPARVAVLTAGTEEVIGGDLSNPAGATIHGPAMVLPQEQPGIAVTVFDLDAPFAGDLDELAADLGAVQTSNVVAYRNGRRWVKSYEPVKLERASFTFRKGGVYLLTGGLGGIGYEIAAHLATAHGARLVLLGRTGVPDDVALARTEAARDRAARLAKLRQTGAEIRYYAVDLADAAATAAAVQDAEQSLGSIAGIVHAAGVLTDDAFRTLRELAPADAEAHFRAKLDGTLTLARIFSGRSLDFCLLMSSISTALGGLGFAPYAGANRFLDAVVLSRRLANWLSVSWSDWRYWKEGDKATEIGATIRALSITPAEGIECIGRVLAARRMRHILHSPGSLELRMRQWRRTGPDESPAAAPGTLGDHKPRPPLASEYVAPRDELERQLAGIWQGLFRVEPVGVRDDFFELGGDSLKAVNCCSIVAKETGLDLGIRDLFEHRTIERIGAAKGSARRGVVAEIARAPAAPHYPLSSAQARIYVASQLADDPTTYNDPSVLMIDGPLDRERVERVLRELIDRHEIFRTAIRIIDREPRQVVEPSVPFTLAFGEARDVELDLQIAKLVQPFDLGRPPHLRAGLLRLAEHRHVLLLDLHHIVTDGVSYDVFVRDFVALYEGRPLAPLTLTYKDYAVWQRAHASAGAVEAQRRYWRGVFADGGPRMRLAGGRGPSAVRVDTLTLDGAMRARILRVAQDHGLTPYMFFLAAISLLVRSYTGEDDVVIGSPVAGRRHPALGALIGVFVNMVAVRTRPAAGHDLAGFLGEVRTAALEAFDHQDFQFDELVRELGLQGQSHPLFEVMYLMQEQDPERHAFAGLTAEPRTIARRQTHYDVSFAVTDRGDAIRITTEIDYGRLRLPLDFEQLRQHLLQILEALLGDPRRTVGELGRPPFVPAVHGASDFAF